ncbi:hypothetical protein ACWJKU_06535 [Methylocaldum sp. MU1018]
MSIRRVCGGSRAASMLRRAGALWLCSVMSAAVLWTRPAHATEVYKCRTAEGFSYADEPVSGSCRRIRLKVGKPDPKAIARLETWKAQQAAEEFRKAAEAREERLVRARELEALAAWQSARAAVMEAQAAQYCRQYNPLPVYFPWWGYPAPGPLVYGYPNFGGYPSIRGPDEARYARRAMPAVRLHVPGKRRWR